MKEEQPYKSLIEQIVERRGYEQAMYIDSKLALVIKPRPKYCPEWLYRKIIKDSVEMIEIKP